MEIGHMKNFPKKWVNFTVLIVFFFFSLCKVSARENLEELIESEEGSGTCRSDTKESCGRKIEIIENQGVGQKREEKNNSEEKITSKKKEKADFEFDLKYKDLFLYKGTEKDEFIKSFEKDANYTDYYFFTLNEESLNYINKTNYAHFPSKKFIKNFQGNFLHFYKLAYEKNLPVLFTTDSMLYALNENIHKITNQFLENVFISFWIKFLENLVTYGEQIKEKKKLPENKLLISQAQVFYGAGVDFLSTGIEDYKGPVDITPLVKSITNTAKKLTTGTFSIMTKQKTFDTASIQPFGKWRRSQKLMNIYIAFRFYQLIKLDLRDDLRGIYMLGKMIVDSGNKEAFTQLKNILHYLFGQDKNVPDFVEIYELGREIGFEKEIYQLSNEQIHTLHTKITKLVVGYQFNPDLKFTNDYFIYSRILYEKYQYEKIFTTALFSTYHSIEEWVINKLLDFTKDNLRVVLTSFELVDAIHQASSYRKLIFNRYKGLKTFKNEQFMKYRDEVDMQDNFEKAKYSIKHSMEKEPGHWKFNINNYYHYLLYKATRRMKNSTDPIFNSLTIKEKNFHTAWGAYIHFKREFQLMTNYVPVNPVLNGDIPEVVLEPHLEFYEEMKSFWSLFKNNLMSYIKFAENYTKLDYQNTKQPIFETLGLMDSAIHICLEGLKMQESGKMEKEWKDRLRKLIYYDGKTNRWRGWYAELHDKNPEKMFSLDIWVHNVARFEKMDEINFVGANLFDIMVYPRISIIIVQDKYEKQRKMLLMAGYGAKDVMRRIDTKLSDDDLVKEVTDRNY